MKHKHNVEDIKKILEWYKKNKRVLPWRRARISAYEVWVSEIMLQQTQVSRVVNFYKTFLKKFPNVKQLAHASWEEFLPYYEGLGYYARGHNMLSTAKIIVEKYDGKFPRDKKLLVSLPGVGEYTASAILSFAYGKPEIAFDTNFKKVFGAREAAERAFRKSGVSSTVFNNAVMDWGSLKFKNQNAKLQSKIKNVKKYQRPQTFVILHENHKKYFSLSPKKHEPFEMPEGISSREQIKKYFFEKYGLKISVRLPHKKKTTGNFITYFVNAQVLLGTHRFFAFPAPKG